MELVRPRLKFTDILPTSNRFSRTVFVSLLLLFAVSGLLRLWQSKQSLERPNIYRKDFLQEYLLARATADGRNPYLPVPELAQEYIGDVAVPLFPHPTPHPPPAGLLTYPLAFIPYERAATVWLVVETLLLAVAVFTLLRIVSAKVPSIGVVLVFSVAAITTSPVWTDLILGQLMIPVLLLLSGCWLCLKQKKDASAGFLLGLSLGLKLMGIPILLFLAIQRRWNAVASAVITTAGTYLLCVLMVGLGPVLDYYFKVSKLMLPLYRAAAPNISLWTLGWRVFEGTGSSVIVLLQAPPLIYSPATASLVSVILPVVVLALGLWVAIGVKDESLAFAMMVCLSIVVHPIAWNHYLVLMAIPMLTAGQKIALQGFPGRQCIVLICLGMILGMPPEIINDAQLTFTQRQLPNHVAFVAFPVSLIGLSYTAAVLAMILLLRYLDRAKKPLEAIESN